MTKRIQTRTSPPSTNPDTFILIRLLTGPVKATIMDPLFIEKEKITSAKESTYNTLRILFSVIRCTPELSVRNFTP